MRSITRTTSEATNEGFEVIISTREVAVVISAEDEEDIFRISTSIIKPVLVVDNISTTLGTLLHSTSPLHNSLPRMLGLELDRWWGPKLVLK